MRPRRTCADAARRECRSALAPVPFLDDPARRIRAVGSRLTDRQKRLFMTQKKTDTIEVAAAKAGFSRSTGYRLASDPLPSREKKPRGRRRPDPLADIFEGDVVPILEASPAIADAPRPASRRGTDPLPQGRLAPPRPRRGHSRLAPRDRAPPPRGARRVDRTRPEAWPAIGDGRPDGIAGCQPGHRDRRHRRTGASMQAWQIVNVHLDHEPSG